MTRGLKASTVRAVVLSLLGALLVGTLSALLVLRDYPTYEASLQVRILRDPPVGQEDASADIDAKQFLTGELLLLQGRQVPTLTSPVTDLSSPVTATQVGDTNLVSVAATAGTKRKAVLAVQAALDRYVALRAQNLREQVSSVGGEVEAQLQSTASQIDGLVDAGGITAAVRRDALTSEYTRLLQEQNQLQLAGDAARRLVQVVRPADLNDVDSTVDPVRSWGLGALAGAVLGLGAALALTRYRRRVDGLDDLLELAPDLALPTVPHLRGRDLPGAVALALGAHLSALTGADGRLAHPGLVVLAPDEGAGATTVAVGLAVAHARRTPTVLLAAADVLDSRVGRLLGAEPASADAEGVTVCATRYPGLSYVRLPGSGAAGLLDLEAAVAGGLLEHCSRYGAVVVDAPALSRTSAGLDLARQAGQVLLVGGVEVTQAAQLHTAAAAVRRVGATLAGVVLDTPRGSLLRRARG